MSVRDDSAVDDSWLLDITPKPFSTRGFLPDSWLRRDAYDEWFETLEGDERVWETEYEAYDPLDRGPALSERTTTELTQRIADLERRKQVIDGEQTRLQAQLYTLRLRQYAAEEPETSENSDPDQDELSAQAVEINAHEAAVRDLMPALRLSYRSAAARLNTARRYTQEHPELLDAYTNGTMTWGQRTTTLEQIDVLTHRAGHLIRDPRTGDGIDVDLHDQVLTPEAITAATERLTREALTHAATTTTAQLKKTLRATVQDALPAPTNPPPCNAARGAEAWISPPATTTWAASCL